MKTQLQLIFPDGSMIAGASFDELEEALRADQYRTFKTRREFRRAMRRRAAMWDGRLFVKPVVRQSSRAFIYSLVQSGMCLLYEVDQTPTTAGQE